MISLSIKFVCVFSLKVLKKVIFYKEKLFSLLNKKSLKKCGDNFFIGEASVILGAEYISVGKNFKCGKRLRLDAFTDYYMQKFNPEIIIGDNVCIQDDCHIGAINKIVIGNNVLIANKVFISDHSHGEISSTDFKKTPYMRNLYSKGEIIISKNVWIGENVAILPGVLLGENVIVGANSVVTKSVESNSVVVGNPARVIKLL